MPGNYPAVPSWRMAYDRDGTIAVNIGTQNIITQLTPAQVVAINDETVSQYGLGGYQRGMCLIFPELRDVDGYFVNAGVDYNAGVTPVEVSTNTTNGVDGTWTQIGSYTDAVDISPQINPGYRSGIRSATALAVRAIRFRSPTNQYLYTAAFHVYGEIAPGENTSRLVLWHPTLDQRLTPAYFDWGDTPRSSSGDKTFRVKNVSPSQTGNSIRVAMDVLSDTTPSVPGQHSLSSDGTTFVAQVNIGALAPGALSGVVTLRRVTPSNAVLGLWTHRVYAEAGSWS